MKKILLLLILGAHIPLMADILSGGYKGAFCKIAGTTKTYNPTGAGKNSTNIGFSLQNKSGKEVYIQLVNGNALQRFGQKLSGNIERLADGAVAEMPLDTSKDTTLTLYRNNQGQAEKIVTASFAKGKTIYINWDGKTLYKQKGPLGGLTNVNDNCYSLENNVSDADIKIK